MGDLPRPSARDRLRPPYCVAALNCALSESSLILAQKHHSAGASHGNCESIPSWRGSRDLAPRQAGCQPWYSNCSSYSAALRSEVQGVHIGSTGPNAVDPAGSAARNNSSEAQLKPDQPVRAFVKQVRIGNCWPSASSPWCRVEGLLFRGRKELSACASPDEPQRLQPAR